MAELEEAVYAILTEDAAVGALVGTRVYPQVIPQDVALPAVAYSRISTRRVKKRERRELARARVQVNAEASSYAGAKTLAAAVVGALDAVQRTIAGVQVQGSWPEGEGDEYGTTDGIYGVRQDFMFWFREAV